MAKTSPGGKGDRPRPQSVDQQTFSSNWDRIFGNKDKQSTPAEKPAEQKKEKTK